MRKYPIILSLTLFVALIFPAVAAAQSVNLSWEANNETDLAGYRVYCGTSQRSYGPAIPVGNVTQYEVTGLDAGQKYYFAVTAVDTSGNESGYSQEESAIVASSSDTTAPTLSITSPTSGSNYTTAGSTVTIGGNASDNTGVTAVTWQNSGGGSGTASGTTDWTASNIALSEGSNVITVTATDAAGNQASDTLSIVYTLPDANAPTITIGYPTPSGTYSTETGSLNLSGTATDDTGVSTVTWQNSRGGSGTAAGGASWSITNIGLSEGSNIITVTAEDSNGNRANDSITVTYQAPDTTDPLVAIATPTDSSNYSTEYDSISLGGTASDNRALRRITWQNSRGGSGTASGADTWSISNISLTEGSNVITVTAEDTSGNQSSDTLTISYAIPVVAPPTPPTTPEPIDEPTVTESETPEEMKSFKGVLKQVLIAFRQKLRRIRWSRSQNRSLSSTSQKDTIDPDITITVPTNLAAYTTNRSRINISGIASDNGSISRVTWQNSAGGYGTASGTNRWTISNLPLKEGRNLISVEASDNSGNQQVDTILVTYRQNTASGFVDSTKPDITLVAPTTEAEYVTTYSTIDLEGTATDNTEVLKVIWSTANGGQGVAKGIATGTDRWTINNIPLLEGKNLLTISAFDTAGNAAVHQLTVDFAP